MIRESFCFLPGVGPSREVSLWNAGVRNWNEFLETPKVPGIGSAAKQAHDDFISTARERLLQDDAPWFAAALPRQDQWRLYNHYREDAAFLDIETDGWDVTVVGIYDGKDTHTFVRGNNLNRAAVEKRLSYSKLIVTFNGASFDLPVLRRQMGLEIQLPHIDLRPVCGKIGLVGGLKSIEKQLGMHRAKEVDGMCGADAITLWEQYQRTGNKHALGLLLQYNEEDVINLPRIADKVVPELWAKVRKPACLPSGAE